MKDIKSFFKYLFKIDGFKSNDIKFNLVFKCPELSRQAFMLQEMNTIFMHLFKKVNDLMTNDLITKCEGAVK
jgi:hypothetical protein